MYDAIVVGARCAGAATAMLLARKGHRVLLVDRATFPSDTLSGHAVRIPAVAALRRWGLLDAVLATGAPAIRTMRFDVGPFSLYGGALPLDDPSDAMYAPRRFSIDALLVGAAVAAGAELREGFTVQDLIYDGERVAGIRGRDASGSVVTERARIVIGADGMRSLVAKLVDAPVRHAHETLSCGYYTYFDDVARAGADAEIYIREGAASFVLPTNDGTTLVGLQRPIGDFPRFRTNVETNFYAALRDISSELFERVRRAQRVERYYGTGVMPFFIRKPYGPGWALAGDAAAHKDPILGQGMKDAYLGAEFLAGAVDAAFGGADESAAFAEYERRFHDSLRPLYDLSFQFAALAAPPPEMQALFGTLRGNQPDTDRFFSAMEGTYPVARFFDPANVGRIIAEAAAEPELLKAS